AITADCRTVAGDCPASPAAFAPNDVTSSGQYVLVGNGFCTPFALNCGSAVNGTAGGDHVVSVPISNPSTAARIVHVTASDADGWIVGGPSFDVGPIAPGGSGNASVTLHMPSDCSPAADDAVLFHAS